MNAEHMDKLNYKDRIVKNPEIMVGKPTVKGTRIPVERVIAHLADNPDINDLFAAFPHLTLEDVKACLAYARDNIEKEQEQSHAAKPERRHPAHL